MLRIVIEEGPETFTQRWRRFAADAILFARPEGSPLLEAEVAGTVLQLLERTNPYLGVPGPARVLVQPNASSAFVCEPGERSLEVPSRGTLRGKGPVLEREGMLVVVDVGAPLLLALPEAPGPDPQSEEGSKPEGPQPDDWLRFEARAPIHGFVLPSDAHARQERNGRGVDDAP